MESQVLQCLQATLSPQETIRTEAEGQLKQLFLLPGPCFTAPPSRLITDQQKVGSASQGSLPLQKFQSTSDRRVKTV